ncbi:MAG: hypothetical protein ABW065_08635 [Solirubrobacterales bacterium]
MNHREDPPPEKMTPPGEDTLDSERVDQEAAAIAAERIRSGAAEEKEDGAAALESLGISVSAQDIFERSGARAATKEEWESFLQEHGPNMLPPDGEG